jgi:uncharacterized protein (DUF433 family)
MGGMEGRLLGLGIYGSREVARLIRVHPEVLARWTTSRPGKPALIEPSQGDLFTFRDLISLLIIAELYNRSVTTDDIRAGIKFLARELGTDRPLAHRRLATVGRQFFADVGEWYDAGKGGQGAFLSVIEPILRPIEYDAQEMAALWRPHQRVWVNPKVQAGSPCVDRTRVPTSILAAMADEGIEDLAADYDLTVEDVEAAIDFERQLAA